MHTRPMTLKCRVATVVIAVPGAPRTRMGPLVWNWPRCEFRRDFCIDAQDGVRTDEKERRMHGLNAGLRMLPAVLSGYRGGGDRGVVEK